MYDRPVMNNTHRGEYVQALVALALKDDGWTRKAPWEGWHLEHESGRRLKVAQSAATQTWGGGRSRGPPQYNIAPSKEYWDDRTGRTVPERGRHAEVYVFAWHGQTGETVDQRDPNGWECYVVPERDLPQQKSIGLRPLRRIAHACDIAGLAAAVRSAAKVKR